MTDGSHFIWAIKNGDLSKVKDIVANAGIDVNMKLTNDRTAIHFAADYGQVQVATYLLDQGANVNQLDKHGISPLLAAIWEGHTECVKLLLERGADPNGKTPDGQSYVEVAESQQIRQLLSA